MAFGIFLGVLFAIPMQVGLPYLTVAVYDRSGLDNAAKSVFINNGEYMSFLSGDIIVDELFIPAMGFNQMKPYFFSKYTAQ